MAADRGPEGFRGGVVDDADGGDAADGEAEGDAGVGEAVNEVDCAVDGVDDEGWRFGEGVRWVVGFFAVESGRELIGIKIGRGGLH